MTDTERRRKVLFVIDHFWIRECERAITDRRPNWELVIRESRGVNTESLIEEVEPDGVLFHIRKKEQLRDSDPFIKARIPVVVIFERGNFFILEANSVVNKAVSMLDRKLDAIKTREVVEIGKSS